MYRFSTYYIVLKFYKLIFFKYFCSGQDLMQTLLADDAEQPTNPPVRAGTLAATSRQAARRG